MTVLTAIDDVKTILVVEDDVDCQLVVRMTLERAGFHVEITPTLHDTLDLLSVSDGVFDAVVLDLGLPDQGGTETLELVRTVTSAPIVVHSAVSRSQLDQLLAVGADAAVEKGTGDAQLVQGVNSAIRLAPTGARAAPAASVDMSAPADFLAIAQTVIDHLADECGVSTWMVTRVVDDDWVILAVRDPNYGVQAGDVLRWDDSFCSRMVRGRTRIVPDTAVDTTYADAPIGHRLDIGCYVGYPLLADGADLFGTLCGIQPPSHADSDALVADSALFASFAKILGSALSLDLQRSRMQRRLQVAERAARRDTLTGLGNRRAWERALRVEEARCVRFGHHAGVAMIDLDGLKVVNDSDGHAAGDALIAAAAQALAGAVREVDEVFRVGGDEFAVLLPELGEAGVEHLRVRLAAALHDAGISAAIGMGLRGSARTLTDAAGIADEAMYEQKQSRSVS